MPEYLWSTQYHALDILKPQTVVIISINATRNDADKREYFHSLKCFIFMEFLQINDQIHEEASKNL